MCQDLARPRANRKSKHSPRAEGFSQCHSDLQKRWHPWITLRSQSWSITVAKVCGDYRGSAVTVSHSA
jgi:hypothetical protein